MNKPKFFITGFIFTLAFRYYPARRRQNADDRKRGERLFNSPVCNAVGA